MKENQHATAPFFEMPRVRGQTYMSSLQAFYDELGHQHTKGANGSRYQFIYEQKCKSKKDFSDQKYIDS